MDDASLLWPLPPEQAGYGLRALRLAAGWTQEQLARHSGVSQESISRFEGGLQSPPERTLQQLARALAVSPDQILPARSLTAALHRWQADPEQGGRQLQAQRLAAGMTQVQLARHSGVSQGTISKLEHGLCTPRHGSLQQLARALAVSPDHALAGDPVELATEG